jgi:hypothetical protein
MAIDAMVVELTSHLSAETAVTDELASGDPASGMKVSGRRRCCPYMFNSRISTVHVNS